MQDETLENLLFQLGKLELETGPAEKEQDPISLNILEKHQIIKNLKLLNDLRESFGFEPLDDYPTSAYEETELQISSVPYQNIRSQFNSKFHQYFTISKIMEVKNTFLTLQYNLMKEKYRERGEIVGDKTMFHGTSYASLKNICTYNFDRSKVRRHRHGYGVSFAKDSYFATFFPQNSRYTYNKAMIIANVLVGTIQTGYEFMIIPNEPCYTSIKADGSIYVKYDDASSYPDYIVYYDGIRRNNRIW